MTRGNQRDIDRARAQKRTDKKAADAKQPDFTKRMMTDAEIMRDKQKKAEEKKQKEEEDVSSSKNGAPKDLSYLKQFEEMGVEDEEDEEQQVEEKKEPVEMIPAGKGG